MTKKYFVLIFFIVALDAQAQEMKSKNNELLLYSQFGEFCPMCEATLVCTEKVISDTFLDRESYLLIHLQNANILVSNIHHMGIFIRMAIIKGHSRPVKIYSSEKGNWFDLEITTAQISVDPNLIKINQFLIDRETQDWVNHKEEIIGSETAIVGDFDQNYKKVKTMSKLIHINLGFLLVTFRLLFGLFWLLAGINKVNDEWMTAPILENIFLQRLTELPPDSFAVFYLTNFAIPFYQPIGWNTIEITVRLDC